MPASTSHANASWMRGSSLPRLAFAAPVARRSSPCQLDRLHVQAQRRGPEPASRREPGRNRTLPPRALPKRTAHLRLRGRVEENHGEVRVRVGRRLLLRGVPAAGARVRARLGQLDELVRVSRRSERAGTHLYLRPGGFGGRKPDEAPAGVEYSAARDGAGESAVRAVVLSLSEAVTGGRLCGKGSSQQDGPSQRRRRRGGGEERTPRSRPER